jgi:NADH-quinone oxidoreductase subunit H
MISALYHSAVGHLIGYKLSYLAVYLGAILLIALPLMLSVAMIIYADRKIWASMALRRGPNVVGPFGLLQSFADGLKVFLQETIIPTASNKGLFLMAPIITFTVALIVWAVIPFGPGMVVSNINVGLLYILAASSLGVYGVIISGWSSNSKYPFYSALRAAAQMVSYEVSIGFVLLCVVLFAGTFNMSGIVMAQKGHIFGIFSMYGLNPLLFPMAVVFFISSLAETARAPFDLTEAESELVAGYQTEYSSMSFALFWLGEYANVLLMCALNAILFWGGWLPPVNVSWLEGITLFGHYYSFGIVWLFAKIWVFFFLFAWVKATVPRYRYDQLMRLGWKVFLPISLLWVFLVSGWLMLTRYGEARAAIRPEVSQIVERTIKCTISKTEGIVDSDKRDNSFVLTQHQKFNGDTFNNSWVIKQSSGFNGSANSFEPKTGSYGGDTGLTWPIGGGATVRAVIAWSDVVSDLGSTRGELEMSFSDVPAKMSGSCVPVAKREISEGASQ